jgi:hypothetical protein
MIGGWRKLHNEEIHNFQSSPSTIRKIVKEGEMGHEFSKHDEKRNVYRILAGKP